MSMENAPITGKRVYRLKQARGHRIFCGQRISFRPLKAGLRSYIFVAKLNFFLLYPFYFNCLIDEESSSSRFIFLRLAKSRIRH